MTAHLPSFRAPRAPARAGRSLPRSRRTAARRLTGYAVIAVAAALAALAAPAWAQENLLVNGSFEEPKISPRYAFGTYDPPSIPGWKILKGTVDVNLWYWQPAPGQGQQSLDLVGTPGAATLEQSFPTETDQLYLFSGWLAHNPDNPVRGEGKADVFINGDRLTQLHHRDDSATRSDMGWMPFSYRFRAMSPMTTLTLTDVTNLWDAGGGAVLDGLSVTRVPSGRVVPTSAVLLASAVEGQEPLTHHGNLEIDAGQCVTLKLLAQLPSGAFMDVTHDSNTSFFAYYQHRFVTSNQWCSLPPDAGQQITLYGWYYSPAAGSAVADTITVIVRETPPIGIGGATAGGGP